jgi:two-component sensor histidine kinase
MSGREDLTTGVTARSPIRNAASVPCAGSAHQVQPGPVDQGLLKEVHHRVKNNLQVVCSLLRLQGRGISDSNAREAFKRSEERIQSMALVYDKLYKGDGDDTVQLDEYLRDMTGHLMSSVRSREERPEVEYRLTPIRVCSRLATSIGLLMNEVISNHLRLNAKDSRAPLVLGLEVNGALVVIELRQGDWDGGRPVLLGVMEQQILDALVKQIEGSIDYGLKGGGVIRVSFPARVAAAH